MTPREGFKYGFLLRCAEEGLTAEQAEVRAACGLEKRANGFLMDMAKDIGKKVISTAGDVITGVPTWALTTGVPIGLGAAALGAGGIGYGIGKMREGDIDPQDVQREELIATYNTQADLARRKAIMDAALAAQPRPRSFHKI
jgi:hypothetical protein